VTTGDVTGLVGTNTLGGAVGGSVVGARVVVGAYVMGSEGGGACVTGGAGVPQPQTMTQMI